MSNTVRQAERRDKRPVIYGRNRERSQLCEFLDDAISGHGSLVLISGEAGIGKTTLVNDLINEAGKRNCLVLSGGCYDLVTTPAYGPWQEIIRDYVPEGDQPSAPTWFEDSEAMEAFDNQSALFDAMKRFFEQVAKQQPLVLVLEDLHWADHATLDALRFIARTFEEVDILVTVTYRDDELTRRHNLYQLLPLLIRESQTHRIHLSRLDLHDIREMVVGRYRLGESDLDGLVRHVADRSAGNPFFAEELLQGLEDDLILRPVAGGWALGNLDQARLPTLVRQVVDMRLSRVSPNVRAALRAAAVIGEIVQVDLWSDVADSGDDLIEAAISDSTEMRILEETVSGNELQFRHELIREALLESLTLSQRRTLHRRIGERLSKVTRVDPEVVAHHFQQSGDDRAAHWLIMAGANAEARYARSDAANHYAAADALLAGSLESSLARGWFLLHIGHLLRSSETERGMGYLKKAQFVARRNNDPMLDAYSQHLHGLLKCFQDDVGSGLREMERANAKMEVVTASDEQRALEAITSLFPSEMVAHPLASPGGVLFHIGRLPGINTLMHTYVLWLAHAGRFGQAMRTGEEFIKQIPCATDDILTIQDTCCDAYNGLAMAADWLGRPAEAYKWRRKALEAYEAIGHRNLVRMVHLYELEHLLRYRTDRIVDRRRAAQGANTGIERGRRLAEVLLNLTEGRWGMACQVAHASFGSADPFLQYLRLSVFAVLGVEQNDKEFMAVAWADINEALPDGPATTPGQRYTIAHPLLAIRIAADVTLNNGNLEAAHDWITAMGRWLDWSQSVLERAEEQMLWARYHRIGGDAEKAILHSRRALKYASKPRQPLALIRANRLLGELGMDRRDYDQADVWLQESLQLAEQCETPYEQALTMVAMAERAATLDEADEARQWIKHTREICRLIGAYRLLERADAIEATLSLTTPTTQQYPAGLTRREVEVLRLVARGLTNAAVAEELYISPRTIGKHLESIYSKLNVSNRAAAASWATEHDLTG